MIRHLSIRLPWHDRGWDGKICNNPSANTYCTGNSSCSGEMIRKNIQPDLESKYAGKEYDPKVYIPPCSQWINTFSTRQSEHVHIPPDFLIKKTTRTTDIITPSTTGTWPYLEVANQEKTNANDKNWLPFSDRANNVDEFFESEDISANESLVFFYLKFDNPLNAENKKFLLVGATTISEVGEALSWEGMSEKDEANPEIGNQVWVRWIKHRGTTEAALFPTAQIYQKILSGKITRAQIEHCLPEISTSMSEAFRFVTRKFDSSIALVFLEILKESLVKLEATKLVPEFNYEASLNWLNNQISKCWEDRGKYPGLGSILEWLGHSQGTLYYRDILKPLEEKGEDVVEKLQQILNDPSRAGIKDKSKFRVASEKWHELPNDDFREALLHYFSRFPLSTEQLTIALNVNSDQREKYGLVSSAEQVLKNPYILTEEMIYEGKEVPFEIIDQGLCPPSGVELDALFEPEDSSRLRALAVQILRNESKKGHTWMPAGDLISSLNSNSKRTVPMSVDHYRMKSAHKVFAEKIAYDVDKDTFALVDLKEDEALIRNFIKTMISSKQVVTKAVDNDYWDKHLRISKITSVELELVITDQIKACHKVYSSRVSSICGSAGSGKTSTLKAVLNKIADSDKEDVLQVAFTGRAAQVMKLKSKRDAQTIHKFLKSKGWIWEDTFLLRRNGGKKESITNLIIDESSMLDLQLFAQLLRAVEWDDLKRIIFVGDPFQLPPIGAGKLFDDILAALNPAGDDDPSRIGILTRNVRLLIERSQTLALATVFRDGPKSSLNEIIEDLWDKNREERDLRVVFFDDPSDLKKILMDETYCLLKKFDKNFNPDRPYEAFNKLHGMGRDLELSLNKLQILSPFRKLEGLGTDDLNIHIQEIMRGGLMKFRKNPKHIAGMTVTDKVIFNKNKTFWDGWDHPNEQKVKFEVTNGQFGQVVDLTGRSKKFGTSPKMRVKVSENPNCTVQITSLQAAEGCELGYATTVHKAQGSEFETVFIILPLDVDWLVSRELIYTALTRSQKNVVLFLRGTKEQFKAKASLDNSDLLNRRTNSLLESNFKPRFVTHHVADSGDRVISKSELLIANILHEAGIKFEYNFELPSKSGKGTRWPDFVFTINGTKIFWEHAGMLSKNDYLEKHKAKVAWYQRQGLVDQLIVSHELDGLNSKKIREVVELLKDGDIKKASTIFSPTTMKKAAGS